MSIGRQFAICLAALLLAHSVSIAVEMVRIWPATQVGQLMHELEDLQNSDQTGTLSWERKMRELIQLGPKAVDELIAALDATPGEDRRMLRSIPFLLRGIGDKRAVPALIRAIPRCYGADGSDMGYESEDPEMQKFLDEHDSNIRRERGYSYGRPVNEIFPTLEQWTGVANDYKQLSFVGEDRQTPRQEYLKKKLFHDNALRWARWWKEHSREYVDDAGLSQIKIAEFAEPDPGPYQLDRSRPLERCGHKSNMLIQPYYEVNSERIFYDLDTNRWSGLPPKFREYELDELRGALAEIKEWAKDEGFELMGSDTEDHGQHNFTIDTIYLEAWEMTFTEWHPQEKISSQTIIYEGEPTEGVLAHYDASRPAYDFGETAAFFYITNEGSTGILYLGGEATDADAYPGVGRRFELRTLIEEK